jgi:5-methyltetrahydropteroyltriglutamate--homocysteine methyltransferase
VRVEYPAITDVGISVQIDEPSFAESWDQFSVEPTLEEHRKFKLVRVEALNRALRGFLRELVRFRCCGARGTARTRRTWSWPTPSTCW